MFGAFSKLFKKSEPVPAPAHSTGPQTSARSVAPLPKVETASNSGVPRPLPTRAVGEDCLTIPYSAIIKLIPQELWGKLAPAGVAGYNYTIVRQTVLEQLPHGAVKVSFGELRRGAPSGVFVNTPAEDGRLVDLPLSEILSQLHPDSFARRPDQARVEVSNEVPDLFGAKGERLAPLRVMEKKEVSNTTSFARQNSSTSVAPKPPTPVAPAPAIPINITPLPAANTANTTPPIRMAPSGPVVPRSAPIPFSPPKPSSPVSPAPQAVRPLPNSAPSLKPVPVSASSFPAVAHGAAETAFFLIGLNEVAENWPDGVRQELAQLKIPDAKVALPSVEICEGLKRGRIQYPWRTLRSWIQPTPIYATPSPHDDLMLELPLRTLTPLFLDFIRANPVNRQAADAENITEFFRKAEQATGTSPDLLQPLFETLPSPAPAPVFAPAVPPAPPVPLAPVVSPGKIRGSQAVGVAPTPFVAVANPTEAVVENGLVCLPLPLIASGWPEPVLRDIAQFGLAGARVEIPLASVEPGMKSGRIEFAWRELCTWLNPPSKPAQVSMNGELRVSLPLGLIAPLFLKSRSTVQRKRTAVSDNIPDLFSATGKPLPPPAEDAPVASPEPPAPPVAAAPVVAPVPTPVTKKPPTNLSELFNEPDKKTWTPNEIVQRTTQLPNVAGALIALQDGLLVASNMPANFKTETIAAFVPQIFGRLNQYSKELHMGETRAVSFTVDPGTVQVYNAGIIYFAALGKPGTILPHYELQLIAGELSRHTK